MARLLHDAGVALNDIVLEEEAHDTLSSVEYCAPLLRAGVGDIPVYIVSDRYHVPRCVALFRAYGIAARGVRIESGPGRYGWPRWLYYCVREAVATPWDIALALVRRRGPPAARD